MPSPRRGIGTRLVDCRGRHWCLHRVHSLSAPSPSRTLTGQALPLGGVRSQGLSLDHDRVCIRIHVVNIFECLRIPLQLLLPRLTCRQGDMTDKKRRVVRSSVRKIYTEIKKLSERERESNSYSYSHSYSHRYRDSWGEITSINKRGAPHYELAPIIREDSR